jgi:UDP-N-acetylmuramoyl-tripeptide--D-alanyl-D-alanine ligase
MQGEGNLMLFSELAAALEKGMGGHLLSFSAGRGFSSVCIDSREVKPGALFVALRGAVQDGHRYVEAAFKAGAAAALVEEAALLDRSLGLADLARKACAALIAVKNTLQALQAGAHSYLSKFPNLVKIGITGSSGKTTTKEIAASIIAREKKVVMNPGNFNSETGLPLSVFNVRQDHEVAVNELGMNRKGEIAELAAVLNPNIALITNIGTAHIGIIGSKRLIALEKRDIFSCFSGNETALIPSDDEYRDFLAEGTKGKIRFYNLEAFPELGPVRDLGLWGSEISWEGSPARFLLPGKYNLRNALAAIAITQELGCGGRAVREGLESVKPLFGRGEILEGPVTVIRECYNANPESMEAAIEFCDSITVTGRRIYVIGSMLELGRISEEAHRKLGQQLSCSRGDLIFLYGEETLPAAEILKNAGNKVFFHTAVMGELARLLREHVQTGDYVLLKGSRGCALEQLGDIFTGGKSCS